MQPGSLADYLEVMTKAAFQTGISWRIVDSYEQWRTSRG